MFLWSVSQTKEDCAGDWHQHHAGHGARWRGEGPREEVTHPLRGPGCLGPVPVRDETAWDNPDASTGEDRVRYNFCNFCKTLERLFGDPQDILERPLRDPWDTIERVRDPWEILEVSRQFWTHLETFKPMRHRYNKVTTELPSRADMINKHQMVVFKVKRSFQRNCLLLRILGSCWGWDTTNTPGMLSRIFTIWPPGVVGASTSCSSSAAARKRSSTGLGRGRPSTIPSMSSSRSLRALLPTVKRWVHN